jgi:hypothetical protein
MMRPYSIIIRDSDYRNLACNTAMKKPIGTIAPRQQLQMTRRMRRARTAANFAQSVSPQISPISASSRSGALRKN